MTGHIAIDYQPAVERNSCISFAKLLEIMAAEGSPTL
jgi:hypothetical protein